MKIEHGDYAFTKAELQSFGKKDYEMKTTTNLIERLWASDAANELTNEAARALEAQAKQIEQVVKITRVEQPQYGYTNALYTHPAPISKEDMVNVLEALRDAQTSDDGPEKWDRNKEAITIMQSAIEGMK